MMYCNFRGNEVGLKEKAIEMSEIYRGNPKVEAIILAGSVARKLEDEHSDIELHILWSEPPEDEDRRAPINSIDGQFCHIILTRKKNGQKHI